MNCNCIRRLNIALLFLVFATCSLEAGIWDTVSGYLFGPAVAQQPKVPVLIVNDKPGALIEVKGKYHLSDPKTGELLSTRFVGKQKFIQSANSGLKWGEEFPGQYQLLITPDTPAITTVVDGVEYQGDLYIYDIGGSISVVNAVPIEDYVKATLSEENQSLPKEALAAIAIAARTNAYYAVLHPKTPFWAVDAGKVGYQGVRSAGSNELLVKEIELTHGMVLTREPNQIGSVFIADFAGLPVSATVKDTVILSKVKKEDVEELAHQGANAAKILLDAFPQASITLIQGK